MHALEGEPPVGVISGMETRAFPIPRYAVASTIPQVPHAAPKLTRARWAAFAALYNREHVFFTVLV